MPDAADPSAPMPVVAVGVAGPTACSGHRLHCCQQGGAAVLSNRVTFDFRKKCTDEERSRPSPTAARLECNVSICAVSRCLVAAFRKVSTGEIGFTNKGYLTRHIQNIIISAGSQYKNANVTAHVSLSL